MAGVFQLGLFDPRIFQTEHYVLNGDAIAPAATSAGSDGELFIASGGATAPAATSSGTASTGRPLNVFGGSLTPERPRRKPKPTLPRVPVKLPPPRKFSLTGGAVAPAAWTAGFVEVANPRYFDGAVFAPAAWVNGSIVVSRSDIQRAMENDALESAIFAELLI